MTAGWLANLPLATKLGLAGGCVVRPRRPEWNRRVDPEVMEWLEDEHEVETKGATNAP
jgi:hypothetical protein